MKTIVLTNSLKCISIETSKAIKYKITPNTPRSRRPKYMKLLGKVDPFQSFLLELPH